MPPGLRHQDIDAKWLFQSRLTHRMDGKTGKECTQGMEIDWLGKMGITTGVQRAFPIFWRGTSGHGNKWHVG